MFFSSPDEGCPVKNQVLHQRLRHQIFASIISRKVDPFVLFSNTLWEISWYYGLCGHTRERRGQIWWRRQRTFCIVRECLLFIFFLSFTNFCYWNLIGSLHLVFVEAFILATKGLFNGNVSNWSTVAVACSDWIGVALACSDWIGVVVACSDWIRVVITNRW